MNIRFATVEDLPELSVLMSDFMVEAGERFDVAHWIKMLATMMGEKLAFILLAEEDQKPFAMLGWITHPNLHDSRTVAQEMFWFASKTHRKGRASLKLFNRFEKEVEAQGISIIRMGHRFGEHSESVKKLYLRRGYEPIEVGYRKGFTQ